MVGLLWAILVVVVAIWLVGLLANIGGGLINLLLILAAVILLYNLFSGRRTAL